MNEIARDTFDVERFQVVTLLMWEGMENQRPAAWRVVFKALNLLEHLVKNGAERCVDDARNHAHVLRTLGQFNYYEGTIDRGLGVREKSKQILEMISDDERVREERQKARKLREKFGQANATASSGGGGGGGYGNQDSWNNSRGGGGDGGYGEGGIYDNGGYSGRYGKEDRGQSPNRIGTAAAPTFASLPEDGAKKKSKKKKKKPVNDEPSAPAPASEPREFCPCHHSCVCCLTARQKLAGVICYFSFPLIQFFFKLQLDSCLHKKILQNLTCFHLTLQLQLLPLPLSNLHLETSKEVLVMLHLPLPPHLTILLTLENFDRRLKHQLRRIHLRHLRLLPLLQRRRPPLTPLEIMLTTTPTPVV